MKMSRTHTQTSVQVSGKNWWPTETARFSRQLVPERASCSLSEQVEGGRERGGGGGRKETHSSEQQLNTDIVDMLRTHDSSDYLEAS